MLKEGQWGWSPLLGRRGNVIGSGSAESRDGCGAYSSILSTTGRMKEVHLCSSQQCVMGVWETATQNEIPEAQGEDKEKILFFFFPAEQLGGTQAQRRLDYLLYWGFCSWAGWSPEQPGLGPLFGAGFLRFQDCQYEWACDGVVYRETHSTADLLLQLCL